MNPPDISKYHAALSPGDLEICEVLARCIHETLPEAESKIWHAHPVWFLEGNPVVGYSKLKGGVRLLFWSYPKSRFSPNPRRVNQIEKRISRMFMNALIVECPN